MSKAFAAYRYYAPFSDSFTASVSDFHPRGTFATSERTSGFNTRLSPKFRIGITGFLTDYQDVYCLSIKKARRIFSHGLA